jgi:hypothetical protein
METAHEVLEMVQSVAQNIDNMELSDNEKMLILSGFLASIKKDIKAIRNSSLPKA